RYYDIYFKFHKTDDFVILYIKFGESHTDQQKDWSISTCFYPESFDLTKLKQTIKSDLLILNNNVSISFSNISEDMITDFELDPNKIVQHEYISNYIYELEKMKTFSGKKLQKKRNHLNAFIAQNHNIKIVDLKDVDLNEIIDYTKSHIEKYADSYRQYEIDIYNEYLFNEFKKDNNYFGTAIYIDDKIVAFTFCYLRKNVCEVIIEKAERDIRGLYQYLIIENLKYHNINVEFMDREDDAGIEPLAQSKKSYYPIEMVKRYKAENIKDW
ncbi:MAG: phosphatidylglycerol lysyltransferase domain-containing protein, partial [Mycoplasma sp.]